MHSEASMIVKHTVLVFGVLVLLLITRFELKDFIFHSAVFFSTFQDQGHVRSGYSLKPHILYIIVAMSC